MTDYSQDLARPRRRLSSAERSRRYREKMKQENPKTQQSSTGRRAPAVKKTQSVRKFVSVHLQSLQNPQNGHSVSSSPEPYARIEFSHPITPGEIWKMKPQLSQYHYRIESYSTPLSPSEVVQNKLSKYRPLFPDETLESLGDLEKACSQFTIVTITLPQLNMSESFPMCLPVDKLDYNPTMDFLQTASFFLGFSQDIQLDARSALEEKLSNALEKRNRVSLQEAGAELNRIFARLTFDNIGTPDLHLFIVQQCYDRCIRPHNRFLEHSYKPFSEEVYGEIMPQFIQQILNHCPLDNNSLVVDLGCGVGNVLTQISICTGCTVYGIEIRKEVANIAVDLMQDMECRSRIWGITLGSMTVFEGDILTHRGIRTILERADLIICNNYRFGDSTNQSLRNLLGASIKQSSVVVTLAHLERSGLTRSGRPLHLNAPELSAFALSANNQLAEVYGILTAILMLRDTPRPDNPSPVIYSDNSNAVRHLNNALNLPSYNWASNPARALYRWIMDVVHRRHHRAPLLIQHIPSHTSSTSPPARANDLADRIASSAHRSIPRPPPAPLPTFFMDDFTLFSKTHSYIESNPFLYISNILAHRSAYEASFRPASTLLHTLHDLTPPPTYPYTRATSAYSAVVQLYARSSQLDTNFTKFRRFGNVSPWCSFGCAELETTHHIFTECPRFAHFRAHAKDSLVSTTTSLVQRQPYHLTKDEQAVIVTASSQLFADTDIWPLRRTHYYLGSMPNISNIVHSLSTNQRAHTAIVQSWHVAAIRLAGRIWGEYRRVTSPSRMRPERTKTVHLPPFLSRITSQ
ncbi:Nucleosomal histone H3-Lys79 methylase [Paramarasmius palmivorus]|uniref:Histone-lysine N-methyltransferase, H3 lysine-79 specific n=1 Tax=Paramarasmius palmivorus TaxID=297713 RepID=A0AAW0C2B9_9AGAR